jgi:hypothetical protein
MAKRRDAQQVGLKLFAISLALASAWASPSEAADNHLLTMWGLEPVRIGMTLKQAESALGAKLRLAKPNDSDSKACDLADRRDGRDGNVSYMVENGRITRIDIIELDRRGGSSMRVSTETGVGIGATELAVRRAYGRSLVVTPHPYDDTGHYLEIYGPGRKRALIFETANGRVTSFRAGRRTSVEYIELCE